MERTQENTDLAGVQTSLQKVWSSPLGSRGVGGFGQQGDDPDCLANNRQECQQGGRWSAISGAALQWLLCTTFWTTCNCVYPCRGFAVHAEKAMERSSGAAELQKDGWGRLTRCPLTYKADTQPLPAISRRFFLL